MTSYDTNISTYLGKGLASARPTTPNVPGIGFYWATDTSTLSLWEGAWTTSFVSATLTSAAMDSLLGSTPGSVAVRGSTGWTSPVLSGASQGYTLTFISTATNPTWSKPYSIERQDVTLAPSSSFTQTLPSGFDTFYYLNSGTPITSASITFPATASIFDGQVITINFAVAVASFALHGNTGQTIAQAPPSSMQAYTGVSYIWDSGTTTWYPFCPANLPSVAQQLGSQSVNTVFAGPASGVSAAPTFRSLVAADMPTGQSVGNLSLATGHIIIGNGSGVGSSMPMGGDATIADTGLVSVASAVGGFSVGGILDVTAAGAVKFPATQISSTNANTLDDYEEGTWTPVLQGATTAGTYAGTFNGEYVKVGKLVFLSWECSLSAITTAGTGNMQIGGLPFTSSNPTGSRQRVGGLSATKVTFPSGVTQISASISDSASVIGLIGIGSGITEANLVPGDILASSVINGSTVYEAAA